MYDNLLKFIQKKSRFTIIHEHISKYISKVIFYSRFYQKQKL